MNTPAKPERDIWPTNKEKPQGAVSSNIVLNPGQPEGRVTRAIELELDGIKFHPGDVCGIVPVNDAREVDRLLQALGIDASQKVKIGNEETTAAELFRHKIDIARTTDALFKRLDERGKGGQLKGKDLEVISKALGDEALLKGLKAHAIADIIEHFGLEGVTVEDLIDTRKNLTPRLYTISSATEANPDKVHMTVAVVNYEVPLNGKPIAKRGVCSGYMDTLQPGEKATFFIQAKKNFRLPPELDRPLVMIGPGTGIAPFRAFAQAIEAGGKKHSDVVLYSGGQYDVDKLYAEEFAKAHAKGVLTEPAHYAVSREGDKQRVQQLLKRDARRLRELADKGGLFYICGSETMGHDVVKNLQEIAPILKEKEKEQIKMDVY